mgnify:CR=1 FL=1
MRIIHRKDYEVIVFESDADAKHYFDLKDAKP